MNYNIQICVIVKNQTSEKFVHSYSIRSRQVETREWNKETLCVSTLFPVILIIQLRYGEIQ